jgi:hypothetical protein
MKKKGKLLGAGIAVLTVIVFVLFGCEQLEDSLPTLDNGDAAGFVAVTDIAGVPTGGVAGAALDLSDAAAQPSDATNKTVTWSVAADSAVSADNVTIDEATVTSTVAGTLKLTATIANGAAEGSPFTQTFPIEVVDPSHFVAVTGITGVPATGTAGTDIDLGAATAQPGDATNKTIVWTVKNAGGTGVTGIMESKATPQAAGTLTLTATVANGLPESGDFTQDFTVTVSSSNSTEQNTPQFTGEVKSKITGPMTKGGPTRRFTVDAEGAVVWTVEGGSPDGGTSINETGRLTVGKDEASIILTVKAASAETGEELGTAIVKVKGWLEITSGFEDLFTNITTSVISIGVTAAAYGNGLWVMGGGSSETKDAGTIIPVVTYTEDEGKTLTKGIVTSTNKLIEEETIECIIYDGPEHDKKFVIGTYRGGVLWSRDGKNWTKVKNVFKIVYGGKTDEPMGLIMKPIVYGGGKYVVTKGDGAFAYSDNAETWTIGGPMYDKTVTGSMTYLGLRYGTGLLGGSNTGMFLAEYRNSDKTIINIYSADGINWTVLDVAQTGTLDFKAAPPAGYNRDLTVPVDTSDVQFAGDAAFAKKVSFVASGNGKLFAFGFGNRVAMAYADAFPVNNE